MLVNLVEACRLLLKVFSRYVLFRVFFFFIILLFSIKKWENFGIGVNNRSRSNDTKLSTTVDSNWFLQKKWRHE